MENRSSISIIFKEKDFLALSKPAGLLVHPIRGSPPKVIQTARKRAGETSNGIHKTNQNDKTPTLVDWLLINYPEVKKVGENNLRPGIIHRLDKDTSGVIIIARTQTFFNYFKELLQNRKVVKIYKALVYGKLEGKKLITSPIGLKSGSTRRGTKGKNLKIVKPAETEVIPLKVFKRGERHVTLVKVVPKTGRTHQIRVHLASINHSIVGDKIYGQKDKRDQIRQLLHAESVEFSLPNGKRIRLEAELPKDFTMYLKELTKS